MNRDRQFTPSSGSRAREAPLRALEEADRKSSNTVKGVFKAWAAGFGEEPAKALKAEGPREGDSEEENIRVGVAGEQPETQGLDRLVEEKLWICSETKKKSVFQEKSSRS